METDGVYLILFMSGVDDQMSHWALVLAQHTEVGMDARGAKCVASPKH